jgi:hypothetical protein
MSPVKYELGFYIPEDDILHSHRHENLKSNMVVQFRYHFSQLTFMVKKAAPVRILLPSCRVRNTHCFNFDLSNTGILASKPNQVIHKTPRFISLFSLVDRNIALG